MTVHFDSVLTGDNSIHAYNLLSFDGIVDSLSGANYFSKLDLRKGYWNVQLEK
ncbi:hypothetical protein DPMN_185846 [Dreissena polymorpha]|uniref:Reverse transcriptase n=1 Tax=Dreissena polymorpha TaxID=45954 RepID=A0A9D4DLT2_DREPO|nr:hypothetical protein DPMN_185846 [Dreissena polymorpha]